MTKKSHHLSAAQDKIIAAGALSYNGDIGLLYNVYSEKKQHLKLLTSLDGTKFTPVSEEIKVVNKNNKQENLSGCSYFHVSNHENNRILTYLKNHKGKKSLIWATSKDSITWQVQGQDKTINEPGCVVPYFKYKNQYAMYYGDTFIQIAFSKSLKKWESSPSLLLAPRENFFDFAPLTIMTTALTDKGIFVIYDTSFTENDTTSLCIGGAIFSKDEPHRLIWRSEMPLWEQKLSQKETLQPLCALIHNNEIFLYWTRPNGEAITTAIPHPFPVLKPEKKDEKNHLNLKRYLNNPIISPAEHNEWENDGTFNPAALYQDGQVHLVYRAVGTSGISVFGYASSKNGYDITERLPQPIYFPREEFEGSRTKSSQYIDLYKSGGGWGGCEDPKLTFIDDKVYMTYVAHNGWGPPRAAITYISKENFNKRNWQWSKPVLISEPDVVTKSACILPEKIQGKYVIFHRVFPNIQIDLVDSLDFDGQTWLRNLKEIKIRPSCWDSRKLSIGATPIKTKDGWLTIYHAVDDRDPGKYKIGAMLLDLEDPSKVLFRTNQPLISPDEHYENEGKAGVVYPCGAAVVDDTLLVYYGGGDRVVCVASSPLVSFLENLKQERVTDMLTHAVKV